MNRNRNGGYSLIEILLAIVLLGAIMVPTCTSLVMSVKINDRTDEMMQAQLAVSSAVETLMAEGISEASVNETATAFGVSIEANQEMIGDTVLPYYKVIVKKEVTIDGAKREIASVTTYIRVGGGGE